jgi:hypothetical protein
VSPACASHIPVAGQINWAHQAVMAAAGRAMREKRDPREVSNCAIHGA